MGSIAVSDDSLPSLTALERIGPKGYLRYVFPFELGASYDLDEVVGALRAGYTAAQARIPALGCEAVPDPSAKQAGVMRLQRMAPGSFDAIVVRDLRAPEASALAYADLKARNFPVSAFDEAMMRRSVWVQPGERMPISMLQANFIRGGLVLTWCILHMFGDGNTFYTWMRLWAEGVRRHQGLAIDAPVEIHPDMLAHRQQVTTPSGRNKGRAADHPEYTVLPFTPPGAPPKMLSMSHRGQVFYFSPAALVALKQAAAPAHASQPTEQTWISTNDALSALLWRTVMAVQWPELAAAPAAGTTDDDDKNDKNDPLSVFNIAIDGRLRTDPPIHPHTLGCFLEYVVVSAPVRQILTTLNLADLAVRIRQSLLRADKHFTDDIVALVDNLEDVDRLVPTAFFDVPGYNCVQTSWVNFPLYDLSWGPLLGGCVQAVRTPAVGCINGLQVALPVLPDGGMEILVGVEQSCIDRLMHEPLWRKYAEPR